MTVIACVALTAAATLGQAGPCELQPYLAIEGGEIDASPVRMDRAGDRITLAFEAPADGVYRIGLAIIGESLTPLAPGLAEYAAADLVEPLTLPYPYDWSYVGKRNVLNYPRLALPGVLAEGQVYVLDTRELTAAVLESTEDGRIRALLLAHRYLNDGADAATPDLVLRAGDSVNLDVQVFDGLRAAAEGRTTPPRSIEGTMVQVAYRGWIGQVYGESEYARVAEALGGVYDWVIVREVGTHDWIPPILHQRGLKAMAYQYIGALRRYSSQVTEEMPETIGIRGAGGEVYTAPYTPDGPWLLADIRRADVREFFVQRVVAAIDAGFDGIFLDGTIFWPDSTGRRGGDVPGAEHSLAWAHWKLLSEITAAVHAADPEAVVGCLGNDYYDALGETDFVLKERMYFAWDEFAREFPDRKTKLQAVQDVAHETGESPLVGTHLAYGVKGYSSIAVRTGMGLVRQPTGLWYLGTGDHTPGTLDQWLATVVDHASGGLRITAVEPEDTWLHFEARDVIYADADCRIELSEPATITDEVGEVLGSGVTAYKLHAETRYRLLEAPDE